MKGRDRMKTTVWMLVVALGFSALLQAAETEKSPLVLYQEALYQEETEGDLDKAIELYEQVLDEAAEVEHLAARSLYQLGMCHLKKGEKDAAADYFKKVVSEYPRQTSVVRKAKKQLEKIAPEKSTQQNKQGHSTQITELAFDDGKHAGKWSFSGGGHAVKFKAPGNNCVLKAVRIYGSRYGEYEVPKEDFSVWLCDTDFSIIKEFQFPYATFKKRGMAKWANLKTEPTELPEEFILCVGFDPHKTKGIYLYHDAEASGKSFIGLPGSELEPFKDGDWLFRAVIEGSENSDTSSLPNNVIFKDSFEDGDDTPNGWEKGQHVDGVDYLWDRKHGSDGTSSLCLKKDVEKYFPIAQWTRKIEYTGSAKELSVSANVLAKKAYKAIIDALFLDDKGEWIKHEWVSYIGAKEAGDPPANHDWKEYSGTVDIPENTKTIVIGLQMYGPGLVCFDDVEVKYVNTPGAVDNVADPKKQYTIHYNMALDLDSGASILVESKEISTEYDLGWDNDGGGVLMVNPGGSSRMIALAGAKKGDWNEAIESAKKSRPLLKKGGSRGVIANTASFCAVLTDQGNLYVLEITDYSPEKSTLNVLKLEDFTNIEDSENVRFFVESFLSEVISGNEYKAMKLIKPGSPVQNQLDYFNLKKIPNVDQLKITNVYGNGNVALAFTATNIAFGPNQQGLLEIRLIRQRDLWMVEDINFRTPEKSQTNLQEFLKKHPDAALVLKSENSKPDKLKAEDLVAEGWKLWQQRKLREAEAMFKEAVRNDPQNDGAYQGLGWAQLNQGKKKNAEASFNECVKLNPENSAALNGLGWIEHGQGNMDKAIKWWEKAVKASNGMATASLSGLTQVYMDQQEYDKAVKYYQMWLKAEPNNQDVKDGLEKAKSLMTPIPEAAIDAVMEWLNWVDKGQYDQSWDNAAAFFKKAVTKDQWASAVEAVRKPLGKLISREVISKTYTRQVPGAPDGEYVIITFKASYEDKKEAIETVTPMLDSDDQWRVSGYFVK